MSSVTEEVIADQSLEEWTLLGEEEAEDQPLPPDWECAMAAAPGPASDCSSDIEVIDHDSDDDDAVLHESMGSFDTLLRRESSATDWSFTDGDGTLDLSPGTKAYFHHPNNSVNFWLNLSLLVAVTSVVGMGLGNYIGSYANWPRQAMDGHHQQSDMRTLQQQLDDCLHENHMLLNSTVSNDIAAAATPNAAVMTSSFSVPAEEVQNANHRSDHRLTADIGPEIIPPPAKRTPFSRVEAASKQMIIRKPSAIETRRDNDKDGDKLSAPAFIALHKDKGIVIETLTSISFRSKDVSKRRGGHALESEVKILLLLTDKGTSQPVFLGHGERSEREKKVITSIFKPFLTDQFGCNPYTVWIDDAIGAPPAQHWHGTDVVTSDRNPHWAQLRKTTKYFWSNVRKKVFKDWKGGDASEFKSRLIDVLLSLPESHFLKMFEKWGNKVRRAAAKTRSHITRSNSQFR